jgi:hypothetical protein
MSKILQNLEKNLSSKMGSLISDKDSANNLNTMKKELRNSYNPKNKEEAKEATASGAAGAFMALLGTKQETNEKWSE